MYLERPFGYVWQGCYLHNTHLSDKRFSPHVPVTSQRTQCYTLEQCLVSYILLGLPRTTWILVQKCNLYCRSGLDWYCYWTHSTAGDHTAEVKNPIVLYYNNQEEADKRQDWSPYRTICTINTGLILCWHWRKCLCIDLSQTERFCRNLEFNSTALFTKSLIYTKCQAPDNLTAWKKLCLWQENMPQKREMRFHIELIYTLASAGGASVAQLPETREVLEQHVFRAMCQTAVWHRSRLPKALPRNPTGERAGQSEKTDPLRPNCSRKPS